MPENNHQPANLHGMRSELKVEKRLDKNGRWVTRHVKDGSPENASKTIPQVKMPEKPQKAKPFKPTEKQLKQTFYAFEYRMYSPDPQLMDALGIDQYDSFGMHRFAVNEVTFYEVLSTAKADDAIALLGSGVRTPEAAQEKLHELGLDDLIVDNSSLADELLRRKVSPHFYTEMVTGNRAFDVDEKNIIDAAEAHSSATLRDWMRHPTVPERVLNDAISYDDIKAIGVGRLKKSSPTGLSAVRALNLIHRGEAPYTAEQLREMIDYTQALNVSQKESDQAYLMAEDFGTDFVIGLKRFSESATLYDRTKTAAPDKALLKEIVGYFDEMRASSTELISRMVSPRDVNDMREAGVSPDKAMQGIENGMTAQQIIAVESEGISSSVSSGWL